MTAASFSSDDANAIDRWIDNVCGDGVKFPAHRRAHFEAFKEHLHELRTVSSGSSIFQSSARSGTREIAALQNILSGLHTLRESASRELSRLSAEAEAVRHVLAERDAAVTAGAIGATEAIGTAGAIGANGSTDANGAIGANEHNPRGAAQSCRALAERYVAGLERQRAARQDELAACRRRHFLLMNQKEQLRKEVLALQETERVVVERFDTTTTLLATERAALADEIAAAEQLLASEDSNSEDSNSEKEGDASANKSAASLSALRLSLAAASCKLSEARAALSDVDGAHAVRFRQSRQRLKDWQDIVGHRRRLRDQLAAQARVMGDVVSATAARLEAERGLGYMARLRRLNQLVLALSAETLGLRPMESAAVDAFDSAALRRPPVPAPPPHTTEDGDDGSSVVSSLEARAQSEVRQTRPRRRRAYALLTHLVRWEGALLDDVAAMRRITEKGVAAGEIWSQGSNGDSQPSPEMARALKELRHMLLAES